MTGDAGSGAATAFGYEEYPDEQGVYRHYPVATCMARGILTPMRFIVDTGATVTMMDTKLAGPLVRAGTLIGERTVFGVGSCRVYRIYSVPVLDIMRGGDAAFTIMNASVAVGDIGLPFGLLGRDSMLLGRLRVCLDEPRRQFTIERV